MPASRNYSTETVKLFRRLRIIRHKIFNVPPKTRSVIWLWNMTKLMNDNRIDCLNRRKHNAPGKANSNIWMTLVMNTATPLFFCWGYFNRRALSSKLRGDFCHTHRNITFCQSYINCFEELSLSARQKLRGYHKTAVKTSTPARHWIKHKLFRKCSGKRCNIWVRNIDLLQNKYQKGFQKEEYKNRMQVQSKYFFS